MEFHELSRHQVKVTLVTFFDEVTDPEHCRLPLSEVASELIEKLEEAVV